MTDRHADVRFYATSLLVAPFLLLVSSLSLTQLYMKNGDRLQSIAEAPTRYYLFVLFGILGSGALLPACFGLMQALRPHRARAAVVGGILTVVGASLALVDYGTELAKWQAGQIGGGRSTMTVLLDRIDGSAGVSVLLQLSGMAFLAGMVVFAVGLRRAGLIPLWVSVGFVVGMFTNLFGFASSSIALLDLSGAVLTAAMGWAGRCIYLEWQDRSLPGRVPAGQAV